MIPFVWAYANAPQSQCTKRDLLKKEDPFLFGKYAKQAVHRLRTAKKQQNENKKQNVKRAFGAGLEARANLEKSA